MSTYYGNTLYPMMGPMDLIKFKPLSFINRIRAGVTVLWLQRVKDWKKLEGITALDWLRKYAGRQVTDVIWEPLLRGKFDRYFDKVTMSWLWGPVKQPVPTRVVKGGGVGRWIFEGGGPGVRVWFVGGTRSVRPAGTLHSRATPAIPLRNRKPSSACTTTASTTTPSRAPRQACS